MSMKGPRPEDGPRVLVTGSTGLLGRLLLSTAPPHLDVHRIAGRATDLRDLAATEAAVHAVQPQVVLHTAYAKDRASIVDATANIVRAAGPAATVVLTSTDCVFSGDGRRQAETDEPDPGQDYGRWKAEAEQIVLAAGGAVVRLPLLVSFDPEDHGIAQVRAGIAEGSPTTWFDDEYRRPAYAEEVATALWRLVALAPDDRVGAWHLAGPERLSRWDLAERMNARLGLPADSIQRTATPPGSTRPRDLDLVDDRARRTLGWAPSPIEG